MNENDHGLARRLSSSSTCCSKLLSHAQPLLIDELTVSLFLLSTADRPFTVTRHLATLTTAKVSRMRTVFRFIGCRVSHCRIAVPSNNKVRSFGVLTVARELI